MLGLTISQHSESAVTMATIFIALIMCCLVGQSEHGCGMGSRRIYVAVMVHVLVSPVIKLLKEKEGMFGFTDVTSEQC